MTDRWRARAGLAALAFAALGFAPPSGAEAKPALETLLSFSASPNARGRWPSGELTIDASGAIYGTTQAGGKVCPDTDYSCGGTVYRLVPPARLGKPWTHSVIYSFAGGKDGATPRGGVIMRPSTGALYGATTYGGVGKCAAERRGWGCGTVFELAPPDGGVGKWTRSILHRFNGSAEPLFPETRLVMSKDGALFGSAPKGGQFGYGSTFELAPSEPANDAVPRPPAGGLENSELFQVLDAVGSTGGYEPGAMFTDLAFTYIQYLMRENEAPKSQSAASDRITLVGSRQFGGDDDCVGFFTGCGVIYLADSPNPGQTKWSEEIIYSFKGGANGAFPVSGGVIGYDRALYGTAHGGAECEGVSRGCGVVYRLAPPKNAAGSWTYEVLHRFQGGRDGADPVGNLAIDKKSGRIYGVTRSGGGCADLRGGCGIVFTLAPPSKPGKRWKETVLHRFRNATDGATPSSGLRLSKGALYGITRDTVFRLKL